MAFAKSTEHLIDCAVLFAKLRGWPITENTRVDFVQPMIGLETFVTHSGIEFQCGYNRELDNLVVCIA
jgi:hypothetical protein